MKMICVKSARPVLGWHDGLKAGDVYDVEYWVCPHCGQQPRATAAESLFHKRAMLDCEGCGEKNEMYYVPWGRDRFIPFDPETLNISEHEVKELYTPEKEKVAQ
jgi:hypothetical protein